MSNSVNSQIGERWWPHKTSHLFACFSGIFGIYNMNRFSYLVHIYKAPFIAQFLILSLAFGLPFLYLTMLFGDSLGRSKNNIWTLSLAFKGLGVTLLYFYFIIGTYTTLPVSWLLTYFKDSFIYAEDKYQWSTCSYDICTKNQSLTQTLSVTVPYYLNTLVLKRNRSSENFLEFGPSINLAIIWILIFICLCYGLRSYGKLIYFLSLVPLILLSLILLRFLREGSSGIYKIFQVSWTKSLTDVWSWLLAAREVVLTWILCSNAVLQICSFNKTTTSVTRNFFIVVFLVIYSLLVSSFAFSCVFEILHKHDVSYVHSSYEDISSVQILNQTSNTPEVIGLLIGDCSVTSKLSYGKTSGYQPIRLLTELFPTVLSIEGPLNISQFWAICFYFAIILFALGQQISIWWCVVISVLTVNSKLLKAWEILIIFSLCVAGYLVSLPMTTKKLPFIYIVIICNGLNKLSKTNLLKYMVIKTEEGVTPKCISSPGNTAR